MEESQLWGLSCHTLCLAHQEKRHELEAGEDPASPLGPAMATAAHQNQRPTLGHPVQMKKWAKLDVESQQDQELVITREKGFNG